MSVILGITKIWIGSQEYRVSCACHCTWGASRSHAAPTSLLDRRPLRGGCVTL